MNLSLYPPRKHQPDRYKPTHSTTYLQLFMAITSYHILLLHKVNHINNLKFDHYSNIALTIYTAYLYGPSRETQRVSSLS